MLALGLAVTGCSSASSGSSGSADVGTKAPIVIGTIGPFSSTGADGAAQLTMMKGWAQSVNDAGGLDGHPVKLVVMDLGTEESAGLDDVKQLVQNDHIVALVGDFDPSDSNWKPYFETTGVPIIGGTLGTPSFPAEFPGGSNSVAAIYGSLVLAKTAGPNFGTLYCAEYTACAKGTSLYATVASALGGIQVKVASKVSATAPDYTGPCQQLIDAKVNSIQIGAPAAVAQRVTDACHALGLHALTVQIDDTLSPSWRKDPAFDGMRAAEYDAPFFLADTPGQKAYRAALKKYIPGLGDEDSPAGLYAWVAGKLFQRAVQAAPAGPITPASVEQGMYSLKNETLGGLTPPLTFVKGKTTQIDCYFVIGIENGKWVAPQGDRTSCAPASFVAPIFTAIS
jgi:branched-chain amino acid transport system substrate-binding protein